MLTFYFFTTFSLVSHTQHTHTHTHTHTNTNTHKHTQTQTHTQTHKYTGLCVFVIGGMSLVIFMCLANTYTPTGYVRQFISQYSAWVITCMWYYSGDHFSKLITVFEVGLATKRERERERERESEKAVRWTASSPLWYLEGPMFFFKYLVGTHCNYTILWWPSRCLRPAWPAPHKVTHSIPYVNPNTISALT